MLNWFFSKASEPSPLSPSKASGDSIWDTIKSDVYDVGGVVSGIANTVANVANYAAPLIQLFGGEVDPAQDVIGKGLELVGDAARGISDATNPNTSFKQKIGQLTNLAKDTAMNAINPFDEDTGAMINAAKNVLGKRSSQNNQPAMVTPNIQRSYELN